jgi:hypothetical protein
MIQKYIINTTIFSQKAKSTFSWFYDLVEVPDNFNSINPI